MSTTGTGAREVEEEGEVATTDMKN